jgi:Flp pilus assembly protein TadD
MGIKKIFTVVAASCAMFNVQAQSLLEVAQQELGKGNYVEAKKAIDELTQKEQKSASPYFTKAAIYQTLAEDEKLSAAVPGALGIAFDNYKKYIALDPKYKPELLRTNLTNMAITTFNKGIIAYNDKKYADAIASFNSITDIAGFDNGRVLGGQKFVDTIAAQAKMYTAYAYYNDDKIGEALPLFEALADNLIVRDADLLIRLAQTCSRSNGYTDKYLAVINKGRAAYPTNVDFMKLEIDYYAQRNDNATLVEKLEAMTKLEPNNAEMFFNIASTLDEMAKDKAKTDAAASEVLLKRSITAYEKAISIEPTNGDYQYALGAHYFNLAAGLTDAINAAAKDKVKSKELNDRFNGLIAKSIPYLEKAVAAYESKGAIKEVNKINYTQSLGALARAYELGNMPDKKKGVAAKLAALAK